MFLSRGRGPGGCRFPAVHFQRDGAAVGDAQRGLEAFGEALLQIWLHLDAIDDHVDVVFLGLLEAGQIGRLDGLTVHPEPNEALRLHVGEQFGELALAVAHHRRQHHEPGAFGQRQHRVHHLAHALRLQRQGVVGAEGRAGARVEQAQVVVDLGDRAHGGARVVRGGLLLDADRRAQALDHVDIGLVHQLQELPRVGTQALDVAPLTFRIERVERQARLARSRQPGDDHQLVARDVDVDVLEVVGARAPHPDHARLAAGARSACGGVVGIGRRGRHGRLGQTDHDSDGTVALSAGGLDECLAQGNGSARIERRAPRGGRLAGCRIQGFQAHAVAVESNGAVRLAVAPQTKLAAVAGRRWDRRACLADPARTHGRIELCQPRQWCGVRARRRARDRLPRPPLRLDAPTADDVVESGRPHGRCLRHCHGSRCGGRQALHRRFHSAAGARCRCEIGPAFGGSLGRWRSAPVVAALAAAIRGSVRGRLPAAGRVPRSITARAGFPAVIRKGGDAADLAVASAGAGRCGMRGWGWGWGWRRVWPGQGPRRLGCGDACRRGHGFDVPCCGSFRCAVRNRQIVLSCALEFGRPRRGRHRLRIGSERYIARWQRLLQRLPPPHHTHHRGQHHAGEAGRDGWLRQPPPGGHEACAPTRLRRGLSRGVVQPGGRFAAHLRMGLRQDGGAQRSGRRRIGIGCMLQRLAQPGIAVEVVGRAHRRSGVRYAPMQVRSLLIA